MLKKNKGVEFLPDKKLYTPWFVLNGEQDQVCPMKKAEEFVQQVDMGNFVRLPKVGHGFSVQKNWLPQFKTAFSDIVKTLKIQEVKIQPGIPKNISHLPLIELSANSLTPWMAVLLTGDGGWASLDQQIGANLQQKGIPVVGFNTLKYFWQKRTVEESAKDLESVIHHYTTTWKKEKVILIGYSFGADVLPLMINRLPEEMLPQISLIALLGPSNYAQFEFHVTSWIGKENSDSFPVQPELKKLSAKNILCFYGDREKDSLCPELTNSFVKVIKMKGNHHLGGDYNSISASIVEQIQ